MNTTNQSATDPRTQDRPTIVLVQGSFQIRKVYDKLTAGLVAQGYHTVHPELPTCSNTESTDFPKLSLVDDALAIRTELTRLIEYEGKTVVVVMHSYGGLVGSEATTEELSFAKRQAQGLPGGVIHLFLYSAFLLNEGQSVLSAFGESPNNDVRVSTLGIFFPFLYSQKLARRPLLHDAWRGKALRRPPSPRGIAVGFADDPTIVLSADHQAHSRRLALHSIHLPHLRK